MIQPTEALTINEASCAQKIDLKFCKFERFPNLENPKIKSCTFAFECFPIPLFS
jgi:hypothetical protein